ncbi:MAG: transporter substrate-binding domain-containing protein [Lachnospiraceae bacterium]|nr:transporter substrate-binding domain-containing protein [Lachnospiraceae bacterium]MBR1567325.1 transporter substrate-binding domain-containing protein [Lachnospiraceae bacterium]
MINRKLTLKKATGIVAAMALTTALLAGCSSGSPTPATNADTNDNNESAEITNVETSNLSDTSDASAGNDADTNTEVTTIVAVTGASPRPFTYYNDDNELVGQNIELVEAIFEKLPQYELKWEVTDFTSIFAGLDSDRYQLGVNNFGMNDERKEKYLFTDPEFANQLIIVSGKDVDLPEGEELDYADLAGLEFVGSAGVNQTTNVENYNDANPDNPITLTYTEEDLAVQLQGIQDGKYDFTTIDAPMYYGYYQPEFGFDLKVNYLKGYGTSDGLYSYFLVSKGNEQLVEDINRALYEVVEEGKSKEINEKYFGGDYTPSLDVLTGGN